MSRVSRLLWVCVFIISACKGGTKQKTRDASVEGSTDEMKSMAALQSTLKDLWDEVPLELDTTEANPKQR